MKRERKPLKVSYVLDEFFRNHRYIYYRVKMESSIKLWEKIEDPLIKMHTKAISAKDGVLIVRTSSSVVSNELSLREVELLDRINTLLGERIIKKIVFKTGFIKKEKKNEDFDIHNERKISYNVLKKIDELIKGLKDEDLKKKLKRLFIEAYKANQ